MYDTKWFTVRAGVRTWWRSGVSTNSSHVPHLTSYGAFKRVSTLTFIAALLLLFTSLPSFAAKTTVTYQYDSQYRLQKADYGNGVSEDYQYDTAGNRTLYKVTRVPVPIINDSSKNVILRADTSVEIKGTAAADGTPAIQAVEVSLNGGTTWALASGTVSWSYTVPSLTKGDYTVLVRATDASGNTGISSLSFSMRFPSSVVVTGNRLSVNASPFTVRGVVYSPVPIGDDPELFSPYGDYFTREYKAIYERDLPLIRQMGANTIRLLYLNPYDDHTHFLDTAYMNGLYVILTFPLYPSRYGNPIDTATAVNDFTRMILANMNHPAVLIWSIGDEINSSRMYYDSSGNLPTLINDLVSIAHSDEGTGFHPVTASFLDDASLDFISPSYSLDIWGISAYRGSGFGTLFTAYSGKNTGKPLLITGFGIDAYNAVTGQESDASQLAAILSLYTDISGNLSTDSSPNNVCIGGTLRSYSDEWWRGKYSTVDDCTDDNPAYQSACRYAGISLPDGNANEEWWGIMRVRQNSYAVDGMEKRSVYDTVMSLWTSGVSTSLSQGWNLISLPFRPLDTAIDYVLASVSGNWTVAWGWENGNWYVSPFSSVVPLLTTMESSKAYWIKMDASGNLVFRGTAPSRSIDLSQGWNFVGYNGTIGIGTAYPGSFRLNVAGSTYCLSGNWSGSDIRWKKNVESIGNALSLVQGLHGVRFNWDKEGLAKVRHAADSTSDAGIKADLNTPSELSAIPDTDSKQIGLVAQDVEKVLPEAVRTDSEGFKAVSYEKLVAVLVEAVKELKAEVEKLKGHKQ